MLRRLLAAALGTLLLFGTAQAEIYKAETMNPGNAPHALMVKMGALAGREAGIRIQVNDGQTLSSATLKLASGRIDFATVPPPVYQFMSQGQAMFAELGERAIAASKNLRAVHSFLGGAFHPIVYADSGIASFEDLRGKTVFTGPPSGGASRQIEDFLEIVAGLKAGEDYEAVRMGWGAGLQAMMDGALDAMFSASSIGSANIEQLGLTRDIRLLGLSQAQIDSGRFDGFLSVPGRAFDLIEPGTYSGQVNEEAVTVPMFVMISATRAGIDADVVYQVTRAQWEHIDEVQATSKSLARVSLDNAFQALNMPLHVGAYRYYIEQGISVPERLRPPEAK
ncbi:TAXI family TRAP transporter solute-binding subunit [Alkalilimnicola sp. S0819]|uniref:TAXI family TRAP transporter solute-binding subunit n=1 Tax=Alkalilimnicola sp. S0819 TaxID=2613922 RepID=UPI00126292BB|nr:TAXI family TRAP transporter solute-binding subunit [Alkalilimnicola sp. S0819]KAB7623323.1 TAXI family TRAP transporter solute-binding subunit [Alkalilimnicola sp. S0819]MPQ16861.1 TAXI family TRAP transporter solute-binding subunit [Alkalilimnicola sp. S0819]